MFYKKKNIFVFFVVLYLFSMAIPLFAMDVSTTSPWLTMMTRFIGGDYTKVHPLSVWNASGGMQPTYRYKGKSVVVALDDKDAKAFGFKKAREDVILLYKNLPAWGESRESLFFDPSKLPFLGQRILNVLSKLDPENYPYYQRRLAEFQSRLDSTLEMGRHLLSVTGGMDFTGASGPWIRAAIPGMVRPPNDLWVAWKKGESLDSLQAALSEAQSRGWIVVTDAWTPLSIREKVSAYPKRIALVTPIVEADMFVYLNNIYLEIWRAIRGFTP